MRDGDDGDDLFAGKYKLGELLGKGGMGEVYAAVNIISGATVAIKLVPDGKGDPRLFERLKGEARALALLVHPNIVRLLDVDDIPNGGLYLLMELVEGESLRAMISRATKHKKFLRLEFVLPTIAQTAEAMQFAHEKGVYHRDLKPENIMVKKGGDVKVLDFGLAKSPSVGPIPGVNPTNPASVVGTPRYMAPEQVRGKAIDARSDIYGLGIVLYEAVSGRTPYDMHEDATTTDTEIMGYHVFADPIPIREHVPTCPDRLWNIIVRCLAKDPADRYQDMQSLAMALRSALEEMDAPAEKAPPAKAPRRAGAASPARDGQATPGPREVRETEPAPMPFVAGPALPFGPATPVPPRVEPPPEVRETQPPSLTSVAALPFVSAPQPPKLGVGHTHRMLPSAATLLARKAAATQAAAGQAAAGQAAAPPDGDDEPTRRAVPPPPSMPPPGVPPTTAQPSGAAPRTRTEEPTGRAPPLPASSGPPSATAHPAVNGHSAAGARPPVNGHPYTHGVPSTAAPPSSGARPAVNGHTHTAGLPSAAPPSTAARPPVNGHTQAPCVTTPDAAGPPIASLASGQGGNGGEGPTRSGPSFSFEPTSPGSRSAGAVDVVVAVVRGRGKHNLMKLSPFLALPVALVLAGLIVGAATKLRGRGDAEALVSAPSASAPSASAMPSSAPSATASASSESTVPASQPPAPPPPASASPTSTASGTASAEPTAPPASSTAPSVVVVSEVPASGPPASLPPPSVAVTAAVPSSRPSAAPVVFKNPESKKPVVWFAGPKPPEPKKPQEKKQESKAHPMFGVEE